MIRIKYEVIEKFFGEGLTYYEVGRRLSRNKWEKWSSFDEKEDAVAVCTHLNLEFRGKVSETESPKHYTKQQLIDELDRVYTVAIGVGEDDLKYYADIYKIIEMMEDKEENV